MKLGAAIVLTTTLTAQLGSAQVCPLRKHPAFLAALQTADKNTKDLSGLSHSKRRVWTSGYKLVTPNERVQFAIDYQEFLVSQGETGVMTDFYEVPIIPYEARLAFGFHWWQTSDKSYRGRPPVDANWVHDALVDAGNSIHLACQTVEPMSADRINQNKLELDGVDNKKINLRLKQKGD